MQYSGGCGVRWRAIMQYRGGLSYCVWGTVMQYSGGCKYGCNTADFGHKDFSYKKLKI